MAKKKSFFKAKELRQGVYAISGEGVNRYLLTGKTRALLFDTGMGYDNLKEFVSTVTDLPLYIVNSHGHLDHAGGNCAFSEPIYIHPADLPVYKAHQERSYKKVGLDLLKKVQKMFFFIRLIPKNMDENAYLDGPLYENFVAVEEGHIFDLGGTTAEVIEIPGHTPGSIGLLCREHRLFFVSDAINGGTWLFLPESSKLSVYQNTLEKANRLDFDYLVAGHNSKFFPKSVLEDYIAVAKNPDFANGKQAAESDFAPGIKYRICREAAAGGTKSKNKASILISEDKL